MARDTLRSTLDNLKVDPAAAADRPYLESALRRMGYTEAEIRERLGTAPAPVVRATEYRLVRPVIARGSTSASPFEDLQRGDLEFDNAAVDFDMVEAKGVNFEEMPDDEGTFDVAFETVPDEEVAAQEETRRQELEWQELQAQEEAASDDDDGPMTPEKAARIARARRGDTSPGDEPLPVEDSAIDTFGSLGGEGAAPRTRVRVRRVRAGSRAEAEAKVAGKGRRVIKSIPVDIVERWGPGESSEKGAR